jgi:dGTPase
MAASGKAAIQMSASMLDGVDRLREFLFQRVYADPLAQAEMVKAKQVVRLLYEHFLRFPEQIPEEFRQTVGNTPTPQLVCDYVSGMTDRYALSVFEQLYVPASWGGLA